MRNSNHHFYYCAILFSLLSAGCSKSDQPAPPSGPPQIISYSIEGKNPKIAISPGIVDGYVNLRFPDSVLFGNDLVADFTLTPGAAAAVSSVVQTSGITKNNFAADLDYELTAADKITKKTWHIQAMNNDFTMPWGMGHFNSQYVTNNTGYEWYIDQSTTGQFNYFNCGPSSVTMAIKWADSTFTKTAEEARNTYESSGGWWYTSDITNYLSDNGITYGMVSLGNTPGQTRDILKKMIDHQEIVILCIDMNPVRSATSTDYRVDKFYPTTPGWGHFFVVKGYRMVDGKLYFEIYDPNSFGEKYSDDLSLKGKNRYYRYEDVYAASFNWWNNAIVVAKKGRTLDVNSQRVLLDPTRVPVGHSGRMIN